MAAAVIEVFEDNGASPTGTNIDNGASGTAPQFGTSDAVQATGTVQIPTSGPATNFSWNKNWYLDVATIGTTTIGNLRIKLGSALTSGTGMYWKANTGAYVEGAAVTSTSTTAGTAPTGYTLLTTSDQVYDSSTGISTGTTGKKGGYAVVVFGVDQTYAGGGGVLTTPQVQMTYDEQ